MVRLRLISVMPLAGSGSSARPTVVAPSTSNIIAKRLMASSPRRGVDFPQGTRSGSRFVRRTGVEISKAASRAGLLPAPAVSWPPERARLQRLAATDGRIVRKPKSEVQRLRGGKTSKGGRKFTPPGTPEEALRRLSDQGSMWVKLAKQTVLLDSFHVIDRISEMEPGSRPEDLARLKELLAVLAEVEEVARMAKAQLGKLERRLGAAPGVTGARKTNGRSNEASRRDER